MKPNPNEKQKRFIVQFLVQDETIGYNPYIHPTPSFGDTAMAFQEYKIPRQAFDDCTAQGRVDDAVEYWEKKLNAEKPFNMDACRRTLESSGAWNDAQIVASSPETIRQSALWVAAGGAESSVTHRNTKNVWIYFGE